MKEKCTCPNMDVQVFTPQEYIAGCWYLTIMCDGWPVSPNGQYQNHVFYGTTGSHYFSGIVAQGHGGPHEVKTFKYKGDTPPDPLTYLNDPDVGFGEVQSIVASIDALNHGGQDFVHNKTDEYSVGYTWPSLQGSGYDYCFTETPPHWEEIVERPNAS